MEAAIKEHALQAQKGELGVKTLKLHANRREAFFSLLRTDAPVADAEALSVHAKKALLRRQMGAF